MASSAFTQPSVTVSEAFHTGLPWAPPFTCGTDTRTRGNCHTLAHLRCPLAPAVAHTHLDVDVQRAGAGAVPAGQRVEEVDAVGVVLLQGGHVQVSLLA